MRKNIYRTVVLIIIVLLTFSSVVFAQNDAPLIDLGLSRLMGYGGFGGEIQGSFSISASYDEPLTKVVFFYDDTFLGEDAESPFKLQFNTSVIEPGLTSFSAVGYLTNGDTVESEVIQRTILDDDEVNDSMIGLVLPIIVLVAVVFVISGVLQLVRGKKGGSFTLGKYSAAGGAVCKSCGLPFSRNFLSPNLLVGKLERCPHCGKVAILPSASKEALQEAEQRYLSSAEPTGVKAPETEEEKLRKMADDSRFDQN